MKRIAFTLFALLLLLAGCGDKDSKKEEQASTQNNKTEKTADQKDNPSEKEQKEKATAKKEKQSEQAADTENNNEMNSQQQTQQQGNQAQTQNSGNQATVNTQQSPAHQNADDTSKIALAFFGNDIDHYSLTQSEIMKGVYEYQGPGMTSTRQVNQLTLKRMPAIPNAPQGMKFYTVMPPKGNFATIIGVNDNKVFVGGTQGALVDYQKLLTTGKEMNAQSLYQAHKNDPALTTITNKIQITN
ncbi:hypothetical protein [Staphylococcus delphini]|uniref:hypothetical protein n=1 Tax=Staphylococcus delphini TaxID=53344 RepID=UPI0023B32331|nr:hypothetical protein [Staphylococcus delphini]MDE9751823.1 hypothetical protein [Staphylococcus delphini]MDE9789100.1 hypothetical protein [Staphylococcus delphini]MDE9791268.1 hypothetical protein [Staphylococcus delphini]MDE9793597.1 hypothetical protein [Staphylococcus delphini]MDE9796053.1 hypothetical protein [Staphylococcus delphini]